MIKKLWEKINNNTQYFSDDERNYMKKFIDLNILKNEDNVIMISKKFKIGYISVKAGLIKFVPLNELSKTINIAAQDVKSAYDKDMVIVKVVFNPRGSLKGKVEHIIQRSNNAILVYVKDKQLFDLKNNILLKLDISLDGLIDNDILVIKDDKIKEHLGNIKDSKIDEKISLILFSQNYRIDESYDDEYKEISDYSSRTDLTHLDFSTIDPASAKDHDDAIYYDESAKVLYVAIADVSAYVKEGTPLDEQAKRRAFSVYLPNKVLPMIPFSLSANLCSLMPNVKRLAYVLKMTLDVKGIKVKKSELIEAVIESKMKYSYEQIDEQIKESSLNSSLDALYKLSTKFRKKRLYTGYDFRTSEYRLLLDDEEKLTSMSEEHGSPSHSLVEECMLLANQEAAKKLNGFGIYRIHEEPDTKKLDQLIESLNLLGLKVKLKNDIHSTIISMQQKAENFDMTEEVDTLIIQSQQQARYTSKVFSHFGLGYSHYSHFTSPIRRYSDLVLHRILKSKNTPKDIDDVCEDISNKERDIARLVWDLEERKYARWAFEHIGEVCEAKIVGIDDKAMVETINFMPGIQMGIENYSGEKLLEKIKIKIVSSDIISKQIVAKII